jgi:acetylglutamate kinase
MKKPIVVKIGGSTFGSGETVIEDLVALQKEGKSLVVVHGGGNILTEWLSRLGIATRIVDGLRATPDVQTLQVVVGVLCGTVNKELVAAIQSQGGRAIGLSGIDGRLIEAKVKSEELGLVGDVVKINPEPIEILLKEGYIPIVAPLGFGIDKEMILNVNADSAAKKLLSRLSSGEARELIDSGIAAGGMIPKLEACLTALATVPVAQIIDGWSPHALVEAITGKGSGTTIA